MKYLLEEQVQIERDGGSEFMNIKPTIIIVSLFFLFFLVSFYAEVVTYSVLPPSLGGESFLWELQNTWYRSIWFYAMLVSGGFLLYLSFLNLKRK